MRTSAPTAAILRPARLRRADPSGDPRAVATLYSAPAVLTGDGRCLLDGGVLVEGERIAAVAAADELAAHAARRHHVEGALLPALVDAATVVELSDAAEPGTGGERPDPATEPSRAAAGGERPDPARVVARAAGDEAIAAHWSDDRRQRSARRGAGLLLRGGVGLAVDHVRWGAGVSALTRTRLPGDSLVDVGAVSAAEADDVAAAVRARLGRRTAGRRVGVAVAAPPTDGDVAGVTTVGRAAGDAPLRVTTRPGCPVDTEALAHAGVLRPGVTLGPNPAVGPDDAQRLARAGVTVLVVARAAHPPDLAALGQAGVAVALGGGLTSVPDPLADAAAFAALADDSGLATWPWPAPERPARGASASPASPVPGAATPLADTALALVTGLGAAQLDWGATAGVLAPGRRADLVALEDAGAATGRPEAVLAAAGRQVLTVIGGVQRARRPGADTEWPAIDRQAWRDEPG